MVRRKDDPEDLGRKAADARISQQEMYDSLNDLRETAEEGSISKDDLEEKIGNIEDRFGIFIETAEEDYDTVEEFASSFSDEINSVHFHYHEPDTGDEGDSKDPESTGRRGYLRQLGLLGAGVIGVASIGELLGWGDTGSGLPEDSGLQEGQWYSFSEVEGCLSPEQEDTLFNASEQYTGDDDPLNETSYKFERAEDGSAHDWDIYLANSTGADEFGKLKGQEIYCEVK